MNKRVPSLDDFINESKLNEADSKGYVSYKEMRKVLEELSKYMDFELEVGFNKVSIGIPYDRNATSVFYSEITALNAFDKFYKTYKKEDPTFKIWNVNFKDNNLNKQVKYTGSQIVDLKSLIKVAKANPGELIRVQVTWTSAGQEKFADDMSAGKYGSLD